LSELSPEFKEGTWEVDIAGRVYPAEVSLRPFYDPDMARIKVG
jgi:hypothetical protein